MSKRDTRLLLEDILTSAHKIATYTAGMSYEQFLQDSKTMDAVIRNFEIIGEAANRLPDDFKDQFPSSDWQRIRGFRNRIVHDYMGIDFQVVWLIKETFLHTLTDQIKLILDHSDLN